MRSPSVNNAGEAAKRIVREHFLVELDFATPLRLSSREDLTFDSTLYTGVDMQLALALDGSGGSLAILDDQLSYVAKFINEGTVGVTVNVWMLYGDPSWSASDDDVYFHGELGAWSQSPDGWINVSLEEPSEKWLPDIRITQSNGFNHLPVKGTRIQTKNGVIELGYTNG